MTLLREVDNINLQRRSRIVEITQATCGTLLGARVAVLGAAFKPGSDDIRDSPALQVAGQIQLRGAGVCLYDPQAIEKARIAFPTLDYATSALDACRGADVVLVLTEWPEFVDLDPDAVGAVTSGRSIIDGRYCLSKPRWSNAGWHYMC